MPEKIGYAPNKKESAVDRVLDIDPKEEKDILKQMKEIYENPDVNLAARKNLEKKKTSQELRIIEGINQYLPEFIKNYGGQFLAIKPENIVFIDKKKLSKKEKKRLKNSKVPALCASKAQLIIFQKPETKFLLEKTRFLVHEMLHFCSFTSLTKYQGEIVPRQEGIGFLARKKGKIFLEKLNEAIIEQLAIEFAQKYFKAIPDLKEAVQAREEFIEADPFDESRRDVAYIHTEEMPSGQYKTTIDKYNSHISERKTLNSLTKKIYRKNQDKFQTPEDVFKVFAQAALTGKIAEMARLIETLGRGYFKKITTKTSKILPKKYKAEPLKDKA